MNDTDTTVSAEKAADCINFVASTVGRDLDDLDREAMFAALDFAFDTNPSGYKGSFRLSGGYGTKLNDVIFATARFLNKDESATDDQKDRFRKIARVGMAG
jgi:hypothetical protein